MKDQSCIKFTEHRVLFININKRCLKESLTINKIFFKISSKNWAILKSSSLIKVLWIRHKRTLEITYCRTNAKSCTNTNYYILQYKHMKQNTNINHCADCKSVRTENIKNMCAYLETMHINICIHTHTYTQISAYCEV